MSGISRSISILFYVLFLDHISEVKSGETFDTCYLNSFNAIVKLNEPKSQRYIGVASHAHKAKKTSRPQNEKNGFICYK